MSSLHARLFVAAIVCLSSCAYRPLRENDPWLEYREMPPSFAVAIGGTVIHRLSEEPIAGARVTLTCDGMAAPRTLVSDGHGDFRFTGLSAGHCQICAQSDGQRGGTGFQVRDGYRVRVTLRLVPTEQDQTCDPAQYTTTRRHSEHVFQDMS